MSNDKNSTDKTPQNSDTKLTTNHDKNHPKEIGGRDGPDPVRYGDWENNGIASDF